MNFDRKSGNHFVYYLSAKKPGQDWWEAAKSAWITIPGGFSGIFRQIQAYYHISHDWLCPNIDSVSGEWGGGVTGRRRGEREVEEVICLSVNIFVFRFKFIIYIQTTYIERQIQGVPKNIRILVTSISCRIFYIKLIHYYSLYDETKKIYFSIMIFFSFKSYNMTTRKVYAGLI